jgi:putative tricarboxylic transport membrane protein
MTNMTLERTLLALALLGFASTAAGQGWSPRRSVEIVVGFAAGGSQDLTARTVERLLVANKLVNVPTAVVNKPGAGGSIAYAYVSQRPADGHTLMVAGTSLINGHILGTSAFNYTDFTPIASLFNDYIAFSVNVASPLRTGNDLIERLKKDPKSLTVGVISIGSGAHVSALLLNKAVGGNARDLKIVSFKAGTEVLTNLLGGHIGLATTTAVLAEPHVAAGRTRIVAVASPRRLGGAFAAIPTWTEQGVNLVVSNWRAILGPRGMGAAQIAYWENALRKVIETAEWKADLERNLWVDDFETGAQFRKSLDKDYADAKSVFVELGLAKQ